MRIGDICEVYSGYALKEFNDEFAGTPVIKIGNITVNGSLNLNECQHTTEKVKDKYYSQCGDIYIALSGATTGKIGIMDSATQYVINQRVGIVRRKNNEIPEKYIMYFLLRQTERILQEAFGCAQPNISPKQIAQYELKYNSTDEMRKITVILDSISKIINQRQQQLEELDNLIKSRFVEMFGDINGVSNWIKKPWSEVVTIKNGKDYKKVLVEEGGYPVYGTGGEMARASEYLCPENTIIVGRKGTINNPLLVKEKFWNVDTAFGVIPNKELHYHYFYIFCKMFDFSSLNKQAVLPSTTKADLLKIKIAVPPIELQNEFAEFVKQVDKSKVVVQKALDEAQTLFDSLMQKYFG